MWEKSRACLTCARMLQDSVKVSTRQLIMFCILLFGIQPVFTMELPVVTVSTSDV